MAKKEVKEKAIEVALWESANKLRGSVEPAEYKHVVLGLIFLKFANDKFEEHRQKLIADGKEKYIEMADFYNMSSVFFLEETSRWSYLIKKSKQNEFDYPPVERDEVYVEIFEQAENFKKYRKE